MTKHQKKSIDLLYGRQWKSKEPTISKWGDTSTGQEIITILSDNELLDRIENLKDTFFKHQVTGSKDD